MLLTLVPLMGPFHLRFPNYNAVTVRDIVRAFAPDALAITALPPDSLQHPSWQDTPEIALPLAVIPWAQRRKLPLHLVYEETRDPAAVADFQRYLSQYPQGRQTLGEVESALRPLQGLLEQSLTLSRILNDVLPVVRYHQELQEERFGDGPGTDWLRARVNGMAERVLALPHERVAVLAPIDHLPFLQDAFERAEDVTLSPAPEPAPSGEAQERALLDLAFRGDVPEPGSAIAKLRTMTSPEARYHEANLLLAHGHFAEALESLEAASHGDFAEPYYLPGYLLSRLGQVRDLAGERQAALRAYRGVLALEWAPAEALEVAKAGLERPFELPSEEANGEDA
jgi:tetratricopeptide (TPR) repeat protein